MTTTARYFIFLGIYVVDAYISPIAEFIKILYHSLSQKRSVELGSDAHLLNILLSGNVVAIGIDEKITMHDNLWVPSLPAGHRLREGSDKYTSIPAIIIPMSYIVTGSTLRKLNAPEAIVLRDIRRVSTTRPTKKIHDLYSTLSTRNGKKTGV